MLDSDFIPSRPIEFHFYSAEEGGLLGSQKVAAHYKKTKIPVYAVYHSDMTGYLKDANSPHVGIITDNVSKDLISSVEMVVDAYAGIPWIHMKCGYACSGKFYMISDHATWTQAGVHSAAAFEGLFEEQNPNIHSVKDTVANINFEHMKAFVRVVVVSRNDADARGSLLSLHFMIEYLNDNIKIDSNTFLLMEEKIACSLDLSSTRDHG
jgi:leucyl aminopeptidase